MVKNTKQSIAYFFTPLLLFLYSSTLFGNTYFISGVVKEGANPIEFVKVSVLELNKSALTNSDGKFKFTDVPHGNYTIQLSLIGFKTVQIKVNQQTSFPLSLSLNADIFGLEEHVVTATRNEVSRKDAPVVVNVIGPKLIQSTQSNSLADVLNYQPGLRMENNCQNCGFTQVRMNGLEGNYSQILINGRPIFGALNGVYGIEQIPTNMIERVEIIRGGGSALYGANAIAGTINVITKDPSQNGWQIGTNSMYIDNQTWDNTVNISGTAVSDNLANGLTVFGSNRTRSPYDANDDGFSELTKTRLSTVGVKGFLKISDNSRLGIDAHYIDEFRRGGNAFDKPAHQANITEQLDHQIGAGNLAFDWYSDNLKNRVSVYNAIQGTNRDSYYGGIGNGNDPDNEASKFYGKTCDLTNVFGVQYSRSIDSLLGRPASLTFGNETNYNNVNDDFTGYNYRVKQNVLINGTYAQFEFNPLKKVKLLAGVRFDQVVIDAEYLYETIRQNQNITVNAINPRASALFKLSNNSQIRLNYASGFRGPQSFSEDMHLEIIGGAIILPRLQQGLKPEKSQSISASIDWNSKIGNTEVYTLIEGFYTELNNVFVGVTTEDSINGKSQTLSEKRNGSGAKVFGANVEFKMAPSKNLNFELGGTIQKSLYNSEQKLIDIAKDDAIYSKVFMRTPSIYGYGAATWSPIKRFQCNITAVYTGKMSVPSLSRKQVIRTKHFFELNTKLSYKFDIPAGATLELSAGIQNILNSFQRDFEIGAKRDPTYVYGPRLPRTVFFGIRIGNIL